MAVPSLTHSPTLSSINLHYKPWTKAYTFLYAMASLISNLYLSPLLLSERRPLPGTLHKFIVSAIGEQKGRVAVVVKATSESSKSSTSLSVVDSVQNVWDKPEDRFALIGLGFASVVALWASLNVVTAIDKLPILPSVFELVGILFSTWFVYRYLLFKPDRKELVQAINKSLSEILGQ